MAFDIYSKDGADDAFVPAARTVAGKQLTDDITLDAADLTDHTEATQDIVGAMVTAAGGSYDDAAGTITLPGGGGSSMITADDTPPAPAEGQTAAYLVTSAVSWPAGLVWSTDPDGGVAPTITGSALVSLFTLGGVTRAIMGATFPAVSGDTTSPAWSATLTPGAPTETSVVVAASALATDNVAVTGYEVSYNDGTSYAAITPSGSNFTLTGTPGQTYTTTKLRARDAAGNRSKPALSVPSYTMAAASDTTSPAWSATLTTGTPSSTSVPVTATALATDNVLVTGYEVSVDNGATWTTIIPAGPVFTITGLTAETAYPAPQFRAKDAAGNTSTPVLSAQAFTTTAPAVSLSEAILASSPAGYWKLDEASGTTFADSSGNGRNATAGATSPQLATMPGPGATSHVNFQSGASAITVADNDAFSINTTPGLTLMFLSRSTNGTEPNARGVLTKASEWVVRIKHNAPGSVGSIFFSPTSHIQQYELSEPTLPANVWSLHFVKYTNAVSGNRHQQYINGVLQSSTQGPLGPAHAYENGANPLQIGSSDVRGIAHAAVFPSALSDAEIAYITDAARAEGWIA